MESPHNKPEVTMPYGVDSTDRRKPSPEMAELRAEFWSRAKLIQDIKTDLDDMKEILANIKGFLRVFVMVERVAVFCTKIAALCAVIWVLFRYGTHAAMEDLKHIKQGSGK